jgi:hypothetical protein
MIIHKKYIFNIFLKVNKDLDDFKLFKDNLEKWKKWSMRNGYHHILITDHNWKNYVNPKYYDFINDLRFIWNRIDFIRYCVLNRLGSNTIYIDLDMAPLTNLKDEFKKDIIIGSWYNDKRNRWQVCNNLIKLSSELSLKLIDYSMQQYHEKMKIKVYDTWIRRFMLQTTGNHMFIRFCKINKLDCDIDICDKIKNSESNTWIWGNNFK